MYQRGAHTSHLGGVVGGVDRVEVTGYAGEGGHVARGGDLYAAQEATGRVGDFTSGATGYGRGGRSGGTVGAATNSETLSHDSDQLAGGEVAQL